MPKRRFAVTSAFWNALTYDGNESHKIAFEMSTACLMSGSSPLLWLEEDDIGSWRNVKLSSPVFVMAPHMQVFPCRASQDWEEISPAGRDQKCWCVVSVRFSPCSQPSCRSICEMLRWNMFTACRSWFFVQLRSPHSSSSFCSTCRIGQMYNLYGYLWLTSIM